VPGLTNVAQIGVAYDKTFALCDDGTVWAWGSNRFGQLGDGTAVNQLTPVQLTHLPLVTSLSINYYWNFAITPQMTVWTWGADSYNATRADATIVGRREPGKTSLADIRTVLSDIEVGTTLALKLDGSVWAWGPNLNGLLGDDLAPSSLTPVAIPELTNITSITMNILFAQSAAYAVRNDGTVMAWGNNSVGQLGDGTTTNRSTPAPVQGLTQVIKVVANNGTAYALRQDGTVITWGNNSAGQLGDGTTINNSTPSPIANLANVTQIVTATNSRFPSNGLTVYALLQDGTVMAWGRNNQGQIGDGTTTDRTTPTPIANLTNVSEIFVNPDGQTAYALLEDGTVMAWGNNDSGQLGDGTTTDRAIPALIPGLSQVTSVTANGASVYALLQDGTVKAWGYNHFGQLGDGTTTNYTTPVAVRNLTNITGLTIGSSATYAW
jgi:alpha-tubulin suppressor-like RCC1 family protein